jgi:hypothetical protein
MIRLPPNVTCDMLQPNFWLDHAPDPDAALMDSGAVETFNARVHEVLEIPRVLDLPDEAGWYDVLQWRALSKPPSREYYHLHGALISEQYIDIHFGRDCSRFIKDVSAPTPICRRAVRLNPARCCCGPLMRLFRVNTVGNHD